MSEQGVSGQRGVGLGGVCPGGCLPRGCLPGGCTLACNGQIPPPVYRLAVLGKWRFGHFLVFLVKFFALEKVACLASSFCFH